MFIFFSYFLMVCYFFFFFQAEDGIRDRTVTGVQTCALPISGQPRAARPDHRGRARLRTGPAKALRNDDEVPPGDGSRVARSPSHAERRRDLSTSERLNRFLARAGVASRRAADDLIASGSVRVNGERPPATGLLIDPDRDRVTVDGRPV